MNHTRILTVSLLLIVAGCAAAPARFEEEDAGGSRFARSGAYVQVNGGVAFENFDNTSGLSIDDSYMVSGRVGYRFHPVVAGEVTYEYLDEFQIEAGGIDVAEADGWSVSANAKVFPLRGRLQPYALVGIGILDAELRDSLGLGLSDDETDVIARLGVGLDFYLFENMYLNAEGTYVIPFDDLEDFEFYTVSGGLGFRF